MKMAELLMSSKNRYGLIRLLKWMRYHGNDGVGGNRSSVEWNLPDIAFVRSLASRPCGDGFLRSCKPWTRCTSALTEKAAPASIIGRKCRARRRVRASA